MDKKKKGRQISRKQKPSVSTSQPSVARKTNKHPDDIDRKPRFPSPSPSRIAAPTIDELDVERNTAGTRGNKRLSTQAENDLSVVYGHGPLQRRALFVSTLASFAFFLHNNTFSVIAANVDHWCKQQTDYGNLTLANLTSEEWRNISVPRDASGHWMQCVRYEPPLSVDASNRSQVPCEEWDYDLEGNSIITEWNLVCDRRWLLSLASAAFMSGSAAAAPVIGNLCDNFGRRPVLRWSVLSLIFSGVAICFASTVTYFLVLRFIVSASVSAVQITSYILLFELGTPARRCMYCLIAASAATVTAPLSLSVVRLISHEWVWTQVAVLLPTSLLLSTFFLTVESPLWLLSTKEFKVAELALLQAAQVNGISVNEAQRQWRHHNIRLYCPDGDTSLVTKSNWVDVISSNIRRRVIVIFWCWFFVILGYYKRYSRRTDSGWLVAAEVALEGFGYILLYASMTKLGRRTTLEALFSVSSVLLGTVTVVTILQPTSDLVLPLGRGVDAITGLSITVLCAYSAELFPTVVRCKGLCAAYFFGGVGGIVAPLLHHLGNITTTEFVPSLLSVVGILTALAVHSLPETMSMGVLNTLQDAEDPDKKRERRKSKWASRLSIASTKLTGTFRQNSSLTRND